MAAAPVNIAKALEGITGPFVVGTAVSTFLCGITFVQAYTYYTRFRKDKAIFQWLVYSLIVLDLVHTACCWVTLWLWFVRHYGSAAAVVVAPWSFAVDPAMCGLAAAAVQTFYAYRIYILGNKTLIIPIIVTFLAVFQFGFSVGATGESFKLKYFVRFSEWTYGVACWLAGAALADALITTTLVYLLLKNRRVSSVRVTNNMIDRLIKLTVETNGLTFATNIIDVILFATRSDAAHVAPNLLLPKLYLNSLLVSLNSRAELSRNLGGSRSIHLDNLKSSVNQGSSELSQGTARPGVHVLTTAAVRSERAVADEEASVEGEYNGLGRVRPEKSGYSAQIYGAGRQGKMPFDSTEQRGPMWEK